MAIFDVTRKVAETDTTVLLTGETGTGKDLIARAVHYSGSRKDRPFVALNYLEGQTLQAAIERKRASSAAYLPRTTLSLLTPICRALSAVHHHLPHATLTPANIYLDRNGRTRLANQPALSWSSDFI